MSPRRTLVAATAFLGLFFAGSAASAIPVPKAGQPPENQTELRERLRTQFEASFGRLDVSALKRNLLPGSGPAATTTAVSTVDPFPGLGAGQFAAYASATVNQTVARLVGKGVDHDVNLASSHAAHSQGALPRWNAEIGRAAFPALAAGTSHSRALAAEISEPDSDEDDSILPLDPAEAKAPPSAAPSVEQTPINAPPVLKGRALRAEAAARAIKSGCVLGSDLALARSNADDTDLADVKGDPKSPAPLLSLNADDPRRGIAQSLARARLTAMAGQPNRFGVLAETRQTVAPVTFFKGEKEELTIEVAGEWILRAVADGAKGSVTLDVERLSDEDRPLLRVITRDQKGKKVVTAIGDLDELGSLDPDGFTLGNGVTVILGEPIRGLRGAAGTKPVATGTRVAGALDILRLQLGDEPEDTLARVGHMEAALAVPPGGATCPGIGLVKRSSQPTVDAGGRFSWLLELSNPNDCVLDQVKLVDTTQPSKGLAYKVVGTSPQAKVNGDIVTFEKIGPLQPGATRTLRIEVEVDPDSAAGRFTNQAAADGLCGGTAVSGASDEEETQVDPPSPLDVIGRASANEPAVKTPTPRPRSAEAAGPAASSGSVIVHPAPLQPNPSAISTQTSSTSSIRRAQAEAARTASGALPRTGGVTTGLAGVALCAIGVAFRRLKPRVRG
jgi:hypothetical protein